MICYLSFSFLWARVGVKPKGEQFYVLELILIVLCKRGPKKEVSKQQIHK